MGEKLPTAREDLGGYSSVSTTPPSVAPLWLLLGLTFVFVLGAIAAAMASFLTSPSD